MLYFFANPWGSLASAYPYRPGPAPGPILRLIHSLHFHWRQGIYPWRDGPDKIGSPESVQAGPLIAPGQLIRIKGGHKAVIPGVYVPISGEVREPAEGGF